MGKGIDDVMLVAVDNAKLDGGKNVLAACGTVNSSFTSIYSKRLEYNSNEDKYMAACKATLDILNYYVDRNKAPPKEIIMFMNSCSMEQIKPFKEFFVDEFLKKMD